jgi:DNA-directed RNA polymerase subunit RPC12/RpoP
LYIIKGMDIKCTQCGAAVEISEEGGFLVCPYCDSRLYVESDQTVRHFYLKPEIKSEELAPIISKELFQRELKGPVSIVEHKVGFIPFWLVRLKEGALRFPAAELSNSELQDFKIPVGKLVPYDPEVGSSFRIEMPQLSLDDLKKKPVVEQVVDKIAGTDLIHVPFYRVTYKYGNDDFKAMVDAGEGRLYAEKLPRGLSKEKDRFFLILFFALSIIFMVEAFAVRGFWYTVLAFAVTGLISWYYIKALLEKKGY